MKSLARRIEVFRRNRRVYLNGAEAFPMASTYKVPIARIGGQQLNWLLDGYDVSRLIRTC